MYTVYRNRTEQTKQVKCLHDVWYEYVWQLQFRITLTYRTEWFWMLFFVILKLVFVLIFVKTLLLLVLHFDLLRFLFIYNIHIFHVVSFAPFSQIYQNQLVRPCTALYNTTPLFINFDSKCVCGISTIYRKLWRPMVQSNLTIHWLCVRL